MDEIPCSVCTPDWKCQFSASRFYRVQLALPGPGGQYRQERSWLEARCAFHPVSETLGDLFQEISCEQFMLESVHEG